MAIAFTFGPYDRDLGNIQGPFPNLVLEGTQLRTEEGLVLAELVQDQEGRLFWKPFSDESTSLHREIRLYGMGRP